MKKVILTIFIFIMTGLTNDKNEKNCYQKEMDEWDFMEGSWKV